MANKEWLTKGVDGLQFCERLEDLIKLSGTTATAVSRKTGIAQSALSDYLNSDKERSPDCATIITLAKYFSVSTDYLLGLTDVKSPSADTQAIAAQTGLKENIVRVLQHWANHSIFTQVYNDVIEFVHTSDINIAYNYAQMLYALKTPATIKWDGDFERLESETMLSDELHQAGYVTLTGEEAFHYYCARIAEALKESLIKKYLPTAEWRKEDGND